MKPRTPHLSASAAALAPVFATLRDAHEVPGAFPPAALDEAQAAATDAVVHDLDRTDLDMVTIDPPGSMDLDQALHLERRGSGFRFHYAIADVGSFVTPGGALDTAVRARGVTHYGPDSHAPLHPPALSEAAASLLPGVVRPAMLWEMDLDSHGMLDAVRLRRAMVRSRARFTYREVQTALQSATAGDMLRLLPLIGEARREIEADRGGIDLPLPDQEIAQDGDTYRLELRRQLPVERDNAQLSLLTGMAAATVMRSGRVGIQRTLPPADERTIRRLRATAHALEIPWSPDEPFATMVRTLDPNNSRHAAFLDESTVAFRGAGYKAYDGSRPAGVQHAGIAADYAHVTAPLRRLVDRWGLEICHSLSAETPMPEWVTDSMYELPDLMETAVTRANRYERATVDVVEAALLEHQTGQVFDATVIDVSPKGTHATVMMPQPAVRAGLEAEGLALGDDISVRVTGTDVGAGRVDLERVE